jgi:transcriptional regulator with XRE-family HTH domain
MLRESAGLSQSQMAKKAGISLYTVHAYEQNRKELDRAKFETLLNLSLVLNCAMSSLLTDPELIQKTKKARL